MKLIVITGFLFWMIFPKYTYGSSNSSVSVISNTQSSTYVRIETNGEVKAYRGEGDQNIHLESGDGKKVVTPTASPSATPAAQPLLKTDTQFNIFDFFREKFKIFSELFG